MATVDFLAASGSAVEFPGSSTSYTLSWSHTSTGKRLRMAFVVSNLTSAAQSPANSVSATYGGTAMTKLVSFNYGANGGSGGVNTMAVFALPTYATGTQTVAVTHTSMPFSFPARQVSCGVVTYDNALTTASTLGSYTTATATSYSITAAQATTGDLTLFAHVHTEASAFTSYSQTQRFTGATNYARILIGDATGNVGDVVSTTTTSPSDYQGAVAIRVKRWADQEGFFGA